MDGLLHSLVTTDNPNIKVPALRVVRNSGKRLRPIMLIAAAWNKQKQIDETTIASCAALEMAHISTLVHDDIIDNSSKRRGEPTINIQEGVNSAILAGDYLLAVAIAQASTVSKEVAQLLAISIATVCDGQSQEMADNFNLGRSMDNYLETIRKKTAALMSAACQIGGLCAGSSPKEVEALGRFGGAFGMSFQLVDDLLDFLSTAEVLGKPVGNDMKEGVYTMPLIIALKGTNSSEMKTCLGKNPKLSEVVDILSRSGAIDKTLLEVQNYNADAVRAISDFDKSGLSKLPDFYLESALKKCVVDPYPKYRAGQAVIANG